MECGLQGARVVWWFGGVEAAEGPGAWGLVGVDVDVDAGRWARKQGVGCSRVFALAVPLAVLVEALVDAAVRLSAAAHKNTAGDTNESKAMARGRGTPVRGGNVNRVRKSGRAGGVVVGGCRRPTSQGRGVLLGVDVDVDAGRWARKQGVGCSRVFA